MSGWVDFILALVFAVHLAAFSRLWWIRGQGYYVALMITFALLTTAFALRLWEGIPAVAGQPIDRWIRYGAWAAAAVSVSWTLLRLRGRFQRSRQNSS